MNIPILIPKISKEEITPLISQLLEVIQQLKEENQNLKDEIARLKGQKPKSKNSPSNLAKDTHKDKGNGASSQDKRKQGKNIKIDQDITLHPDNIPAGSKFIDYKDYIVQDIMFCPWNIRYRRGRWKTPAGDFIIGELPKDVIGHYGAELISFVLYQYYDCYVTQPLLAKQLNERK